MGYELRDHTADVGVEATGATLSAAFAATADGMAAAMLDEDEIPAMGERFDIEVRAENREALLFDYLDELIYQRDVREVLPVDNDVTFGGDGNGKWELTGSARGVPLAGLGAREIKAVTYSEMAIEETDDGWHAYVVFDV
ncbi:MULTISPECIES: archease [unclassified Haladaptatus]|uniref:archease n=1 Tax=unclassified Haladaptatus TaxID=2622732 RepID=UPI00209C2A92|nr:MULTISPECIES: archease [unclassified Haladaptatus]MCO8245198.1 archease [Haladaptatus sp. AB643]MCO8253342.1 archease [Haladaptatus sp. AB618]